uniref:serine hydrolase n=1 Tax=Microbacterium flavum TaxID=415216 RepID=UPI0024AC91DE
LERRAPEAVGIPAAAFAALADRLQEEGLDPPALLVARGGVVAFETAWAPYRLEQPALVYSVSKTYASLASGFLVDEGRLGLDDSVGDLLGLPNPHGI